MRDQHRDRAREELSLGLHPSPGIPLIRNIALVAMAAGLGLLLSPSLYLQDFAQYWSAARLQLNGGNPFDASAMLSLQRVFWPDELGAVMMWNPPWTLTLITPLGLLDPRAAGAAWTSTNILLLLACANWLWRYYGGGEIGAWLVGAASLFLPATVLALGMGQISPFMLLGLCGFLHFIRKERWVLAGAAAALTLVKPHWVSLFWFAVVFWSVREGRRGVLLGAAAALVSATGVSLIINPAVIGQYLDAVSGEPPFYMVGPSAGVLFRLLLGWERIWLQFLPMLLGAVWVTWYWMWRRDSWGWDRQIPLIVLVSALVAAYGWPYDHVVSLIPLVWILRIVCKERSPLAWSGLSVFSVGWIATSLMRSQSVLVLPLAPEFHPTASVLAAPSGFWHIVTTPLFLAGLLLARRAVGQTTSLRRMG